MGREAPRYVCRWGLFVSDSRSSEVRQPALVRCPLVVDRLRQLAPVTLGELAVVFLAPLSHVGLRRARRKMVDGRFVPDMLADLRDFRSLLHANRLTRSTPVQSVATYRGNDAEKMLRYARQFLAGFGDRRRPAEVRRSQSLVFAHRHTATPRLRGDIKLGKHH